MIRFLLTFFLMAAPVLAQVEARSLAVSGDVLYVGTSKGTMFTSRDAGRTWQGFVKFREDYVIDRIAIDGPHIYVAAWVVGDPTQGAFMISDDSGANWTLASNRHFTTLVLAGDRLFAGSADGVYRSLNHGATFEKISTEIQDVQSIAVRDDSIFVGTWHLGWYSHNGGMSWHRIEKGIIDDSDFFTIVLDGSTIYIGACSGIYRGSDDGEQYRKEHTKTDARRTKVLRQVNSQTLYAGTTDGIWVTTNAGNKWKRRGNRNIVVNDMIAISDSHLVVATSRFGVIWSDDGGKNYTQAQF